jgi:hypothetical protein
MVQVIDRMEDADGARYIHFRVYRTKSPVNPNGILGRWQHAANEGSIGRSQLGTPVKLEFKRAFNEAVKYGVPFLWVDDPDGLFPPADRPTPP